MKRKKTKIKQEPESTPPNPRFEIGSVISVRALVVDKNGIAWWVDPESKSIKQA